MFEKDVQKINEQNIQRDILARLDQKKIFDNLKFGILSK
jgi:hypothetical protein